jgi:heme oxygenase
MLCHAFPQNQRLNGFGDLLEEDLEHLHKISKPISDSTSRIKSKKQQALMHSKLEAKLSNQPLANHRNKVNEHLRSTRLILWQKALFRKRKEMPAV